MDQPSKIAKLKQSNVATSLFEQKLELFNDQISLLKDQQKVNADQMKQIQQKDDIVSEKKSKNKLAKNWPYSQYLNCFSSITNIEKIKQLIPTAQVRIEVNGTCSTQAHSLL